MQQHVSCTAACGHTNITTSTATLCHFKPHCHHRQSSREGHTSSASQSTYMHRPDHNAQNHEIYCCCCIRKGLAPCLVLVHTGTRDLVLNVLLCVNSRTHELWYKHRVQASVPQYIATRSDNAVREEESLYFMVMLLRPFCQRNAVFRRR